MSQNELTTMCCTKRCSSRAHLKWLPKRQKLYIQILAIQVTGNQISKLVCVDTLPDFFLTIWVPGSFHTWARLYHLNRISTVYSLPFILKLWGGLTQGKIGIEKYHWSLTEAAKLTTKWQFYFPKTNSFETDLHILYSCLSYATNS